MFISSVLLQKCLAKKKKERFQLKSAETIKNDPETILTAALFMAEMVLMTAAVTIAVRCKIEGFERVVNIILAILFPVPYLFFNRCSKDILTNGFNLP